MKVVAGAGDNSGSGVDCEDELNSAGEVPVGDCPAKASAGIENAMKVSGPGYSSAKSDTLVVARCVYGTFKTEESPVLVGQDKDQFRLTTQQVKRLM